MCHNSCKQLVNVKSNIAAHGCQEVAVKVIDGYCFLTLIKSADLKIQPAAVYEFTGKASAGVYLI